MLLEMFKLAFKKFKRKTPPPDLHDVVDLDLYEENDTSHSWSKFVRSVNITDINECNVNEKCPISLQPPHMWRCYKLSNHPGLVVIRNPFKVSGQRYWMARSLRDYPRPPNISNLDVSQFPAAALTDWWHALHQCSDAALAQKLKVAMRWTTLGYHHNWDTKVYDEKMHNVFPGDLESLCQYFALVLGYTNYMPQAAIVNYYPIGTTLSGHTDHSELNLAAPLFSYSFGQTAIFLIGGKTLDEQPTAIFLRSGDVLVMSAESRLCYHAVPRVMKADAEPWRNTTTEECQQENIMNAESNSMDLDLYRDIRDNTFWRTFNQYMSDSRININVRQVLPAGVSTLCH